MTLALDGNSLAVEDVVRVAREGSPVALAPDAESRIRECRAMLERKLAANEVMYGINTGIGEFSETILNDDEVRQFQKYLIYNHAAGIGDPAPEEYVRAAILARLNVHANGRSGLRVEIPHLLCEMLNRGVTPYVCQKGSVGASNFMNGMNALHLHDIDRWLKQAEIAAAMTLEALHANMKPYDTRLHEARGFRGAVRSARAIMKCLEGSDVLEPAKKRVQDAYSMRSTPQVIGAAHDALVYARSQVEIELNGVGDNPVFFPEDDAVLTGANFQGSPVSLPMEMAGTAVTMVSVLSERRLNRLLNPALSVGLPPFLAEKPGLYSGFMLSQYTAGTLIVEQRMLSAPAACASIPAAADQEDFVSMGMNTAIKNGQIIENACGVLGIELIAAAQALDIRGGRMGKGTAAAHRVIREHVEYLGEDRPLYPDHTTMAEVVRSGELLEAVEAAVGSLES
jgi:histidine ammonia-lyase